MTELSFCSPEPFVPLLIGKGKLARHLHHYFHLLQEQQQGFKHKHFDVSKETVARDLTNPDLFRKIREVNAIWILTSDQSIESVMLELKKGMARHDLNPDRYVFLHSSAASDIPGMHTYHPLMTFSDNLYSLEQYEQIPFAVISSAAEALEKKFPLPNTTFQIAPESRALYHAYAVMMSNLPILLWSMASEDAKKKLSLDPSVFDPILKQTLENFLKQRASALTGPIARKDTATIEKNLVALGNSPLSRIYQSFLGGSL